MELERVLRADGQGHCFDGIGKENLLVFLTIVTGVQWSKFLAMGQIMILWLGFSKNICMISDVILSISNGKCWGRHLRPHTEGPTSSKRVETRLDEGLRRPSLHLGSKQPQGKDEAMTLTASSRMAKPSSGRGEETACGYKRCPERA